MQVTKEHITALHGLRALYIEREVDYPDKIEAAGWEFVGGGYYGVVYRHPDWPGVVAKLGTSPVDGWPEYARWVRAHPEVWGHGILPVYYLHRDRDYRYVALVKEMRCVYLNPYNWVANTSTSVYATAEVPDITVSDEYCALRNLLSDEYRSESPGLRDLLDTPEFSPTIAAVSALRQYFMGSAEADLHAANVMQDPTTGRIIITDPYGRSSLSTVDDDEVEEDLDEVEDE